MDKKQDTAITLSYPNGRRVMLRKSQITAVDGCLAGTTVCLHGYTINLPEPVDTVLDWFPKVVDGFP